MDISWEQNVLASVPGHTISELMRRLTAVPAAATTVGVLLGSSPSASVTGPQLGRVHGEL